MDDPTGRILHIDSLCQVNFTVGDFRLHEVASCGEGRALQVDERRELRSLWITKFISATAHVHEVTRHGATMCPADRMVIHTG